MSCKNFIRQGFFEHWRTVVICGNKIKRNANPGVLFKICHCLGGKNVNAYNSVIFILLYKILERVGIDFVYIINRRTELICFLIELADLCSKLIYFTKELWSFFNHFDIGIANKVRSLLATESKDIHYVADMSFFVKDFFNCFCS